MFIKHREYQLFLETLCSITENYVWMRKPQDNMLHHVTLCGHEPYSSLPTSRFAVNPSRKQQQIFRANNRRKQTFPKWHHDPVANYLS